MMNAATAVKAKAKELGIKTGKTKLPDLVRQIQQKEGNTPCFQTGASGCDQVKCLWRQDCMAS